MITVARGKLFGLLHTCRKGLEAQTTVGTKCKVSSAVSPITNGTSLGSVHIQAVLLVRVVLYTELAVTRTDK